MKRQEWTSAAEPYPTRSGSSVAKSKEGGEDNDRGNDVEPRRNSEFRSKAKAIGRALVFGASGMFTQNRITEDEPSIQDKVSWADVLSELRRERSRKIAIKEEAYINPSLFCLSNVNPVRVVMIKLEQWPVFRHFILVAIVVNCILLTYEDPVCKCAAGMGQDKCTEREFFLRTLYVGAFGSDSSSIGIDCGSQEQKDSMLWVGEIVFTIIFLVEMLIKIIARGFFMHKHAYLRDRMNWLDFVVVGAGTTSVTLQLMALPPNNFTQFLRSFRVLRPLRTMTRLPGMKPLIKTIVQAVGALQSVLLLLIFGFVLFGIFGLDILKGGMRGRCYVDPTNNQFTSSVYSRLISQQTPFLAEARSGTICAPSGWVRSEGNFLGGVGCDQVVLEGIYYNVTCSRKKWCQHQKSIKDPTKWGEWCTYDYNPNPFDIGAGWFSYDNFWGSFLCIFQTLTLEGWVDLMYSIGDGVSIWGSRIFHVMWVVLGSLIIIQLVLAQLSISYTQATDEVRHNDAREALSLQAILREEDREKRADRQRRVEESESPSRLIHIENGTKSGDQTIVTNTQMYYSLWKAARSHTRIIVKSQIFSDFITVAIILNTINMIIFTWHDQNYFEDQICKRRCELDAHLPAGSSDDCSGPLFNHTFVSDGSRGRQRLRQENFCFLENSADKKFASWSKFKGANCSRYTDEAECNKLHLGAPGTGCWWKDNSCQLGLYTASEFAVIDTVSPALGSGTLMPSSDRSDATLRLSLRHFCGESIADFQLLCPQYREDWQPVSDVINVVLTVTFIFEAVSKLFGLGPREYFSEMFNIVDFLIVVASILEMAQLGMTDVSVFRILRLTRLFKLMKRMPEVQKTFRALMVALRSMTPLIVVLFIFIFMASALMMTMFANSFRFNKTDWPRSNFDSFFMSERGHGAFTTVYQMLTTENWNIILFNCMRTSSPGDWGEDSFSSVFLFALPSIFIVLVGNYIFINLFISILLEGFDESNESDDAGEEGPKESAGPKENSQQRKVRALVRRLSGQSFRIKPASNVEKMKGEDQTEDGKEGAGLRQVMGYLGKPLTYPADKSFGVFATDNPVRILAGSICQHSLFDHVFILLCILITTILLLFEKPEWSLVSSTCPRPPENLDCSGLSPGHEITNCQYHARHPDFGRVWKPCNHTEPGEVAPCCRDVVLVEAFAITDKIFSTIFLIEMVLKMLTSGLFLHEHSYLRDSWNVLDCLVSILGMISAFGDGDEFKSLKVLRVVRALRPLRVVRRHPNLRVAVLGLMSSVPAIVNVMPLLIFWYTLYAMLGVSLYKGQLYSCYNSQDMRSVGVAASQEGPRWEPTIALAGPEAVPTIIECVTAGNGDTVWSSKPYSFNNYFAGFLTLWEMATTEGWLDVMAGLTDSSSFPGVTPLPNLNPFLPTLFCMVQIFFGSFIFMNVIISKVINNYTKVRMANNGETLFITKEQKEWKSTRMLIMKLKPRVRVEGPKNKIRRFMFELSLHYRFEMLITMCIVLNILSMMVDSLEYEALECFTATLFWINVVFTLIFLTEAGIKLTGLGPRWYFLDSWNILDFIVVIFSIIIVVLDIQSQEYLCQAQVGEGFSAIRVLRAFHRFVPMRAGSDTVCLSYWHTAHAAVAALQYMLQQCLRILRVLRLIRRLPALRVMITTFYISLPAVVNFGALILLILCIFSVLGMWLFFNVNLEQDEGAFMDDNVSYRHFDSAFFSLFRQTTGEAWNGLMYYCAESDKYLACAQTQEYWLMEGCAMQAAGYAYHILWNVFAAYAMIQLFTAVILENFIEVVTGDSTDQDKFNEFVEVWTKLDPDAAEEISIDLLPDLLIQLPPPLGLKSKDVTPALLMQLIKDLRIPIHNKHIRYKDTFMACVKRTIVSQNNLEDKDDDDNGFTKPKDDNLAPSPTSQGAGNGVTVDVQESNDITSEKMPTPHDAAEDYAARTVQRAYREWREKRIHFFKGMNWRTTMNAEDDAKSSPRTRNEN